jgi:hypothetical protein
VHGRGCPRHLVLNVDLRLVRARSAGAASASCPRCR